MGQQISSRDVTLAAVGSVVVAFAAAIPFATYVTYFFVVLPMEALDRPLAAAYAQLGDSVMEAARLNVLIGAVWLGTITSLALWRTSARLSSRQPWWRKALALLLWAGIASTAGVFAGAVLGGLFSIPVWRRAAADFSISGGPGESWGAAFPWILGATVVLIVIEGVLDGRDRRRAAIAGG